MLAELQKTEAAVPAHHLPIYRLEAELLKLPQVDMPVEHEFCSGLYARTMRIPAGTVLTGAVHAGECFMVIRSGDIVITTDAGAREFTGGDVVKSKAGTKRAGVALTDTVLTTFHPNPDDETDPIALWQRFTVSAPVLGLTPSQRLLQRILAELEAA